MMKAKPTLIALVLLFASVAGAQEPPAATEAESDPALAALGVGPYGTHGSDFILWENPKTGAYVKPIIWVSGGIVGYFPSNPGNANFSSSDATVILSRFGFEGALASWASFKLELERDLGFSLTTNGPQGTSVWEGTASIQARENYVDIHKWGLSLTVGIEVDPASVDFISPHLLDLFGSDPYVRDYLLYAGFDMGQGVLLRYQDPLLGMIGLPGRLTYGFQFTAGNPLTTSLSYGFGGTVTALGTLYTAPLRTETNGVPGTNISLQTFSPSIVYDVDFAKGFGFDLRAAAQFYVVDVDTTSNTDASLTGNNLRVSGRVRLPYVSLMGSYAHRKNQQLAVPDLTQRLDIDYVGRVWSIGGELNYGPFGIGAHYAAALLTTTPTVHDEEKFFNIGVSYQLMPGFLGATLRYGQVKHDAVNLAATPTDAKSLFATLHMMI